MKAEAQNIRTGEKIAVTLSDEQSNLLADLARDRVSDKQLDACIDNLDISADAKAIVSSILKSTIRVGKAIIKVGKRIIEIALAIVAQFPNMTFGLILGLVVAALVSSIPILGFLFGALVTPIAIAFGLTMGYVEDLKDKALARKISEAEAMFEPLKGDI